MIYINLLFKKHISKHLNIVKCFFGGIQAKYVSTIEQCDDNKLYQWKQPNGYDTGIQVTNSYRCLGKQNKCKKVPLIVKNPRYVTWYSCGPTVYDSPHIGHASSYIRLDAIRRVLCFHFHLNIVFVMGITDIDDKVINRANLLGKEFLSMARYYEQEFKAALKNLNVLPPFMYVRVSDVIPEILAFVNRLLLNGNAYQTTEGNVWFNVNRFTHLGRLAYMLEEWESETSNMLLDKKSSRDFALWKAAKPGEPYWDAPWGKGRPGWHIECSTISSVMFGNDLDIHTGAKDLCLHHECEILQSEAFHATGQWVSYFLHTGHLMQNNSALKMSKSLGNVVTVKDFLKKYSPDDLRMFCLSNNSWNSNLVYKQKLMHAAIKNVNRIKAFLSKCNRYVLGSLDGEVNEVEVERLLANCMLIVDQCLRDDFNFGKAINALTDLCGNVGKMFTFAIDEENWEPRSTIRHSLCIIKVSCYIVDAFRLFGFQSFNVDASAIEFTCNAEENAVQNDLFHDLIQLRSDIRKIAYNMKHTDIDNSKTLFQISDEVRKKLIAKGTIIEDTKH